MPAPFDPNSDIPDLSGKVVLVTGGNSGLGEATIAALAQHGPAKIYLAARSQSKALAAVDRIKSTTPNANIEVLELDLASFHSVKSAAARFIKESSRLDILQLNGGVAAIPHAITKDGYEIQLGTNYMGHALLTQLLMPKLLETAKTGADVRVVSMSSVSHKRYVVPKSGMIDFNQFIGPAKSTSGFQLYDMAMLAKTLFAYDLAKRYPSLTVSSFHPGIVKTNAWSGDKAANPWLVMVLRPIVGLIGVSKEEGAKTQLWCSVSKEVKSGSYYEPVGKAGQEGKFSRDDKLADSLWEWTTAELLKHGGPGWPDNSQ